MSDKMVFKIFGILIGAIFLLLACSAIYLQTIGKGDPRILKQMHSPNGSYIAILYTHDNYFGNGGVKILTSTTGEIIGDVSLPSFDERYVDSVSWIDESELLILGYDMVISVDKKTAITPGGSKNFYKP